MDKQHTVLIVDDSLPYRQKIESLYESLGWKCVALCASAIECLEYLDKNPAPDLISLDIIMPEMHGFELLEILKKNEYKSKIVMLSGLPQQAVEDQINRLTLKPDGHISKKESKEAFEAHIEKIMGEG